jgi:hypothetical protein
MYRILGYSVEVMYEDEEATSPLDNEAEAGARSPSCEPVSPVLSPGLPGPRSPSWAPESPSQISDGSRADSSGQAARRPSWRPESPVLGMDEMSAGAALHSPTPVGRSPQWEPTSAVMTGHSPSWSPVSPISSESEVSAPLRTYPPGPFEYEPTSPIYTPTLTSSSYLPEPMNYDPASPAYTPTSPSSTQQYDSPASPPYTPPSPPQQLHGDDFFDFDGPTIKQQETEKQEYGFWSGPAFTHTAADQVELKQIRGVMDLPRARADVRPRGDI